MKAKMPVALPWLALAAGILTLILDGYWQRTHARIVVGDGTVGDRTVGEGHVTDRPGDHDIAGPFSAATNRGPGMDTLSPVPNPKVLSNLSLEMDPVCHMQVSLSRSHTVQFEGEAFAFCSTYCRDEFTRAPRKFVKTRSLPPESHTMRGIPTWLYQVAIGILILLSFGFFEGREAAADTRSRDRGVARFDLLPAGMIRTFIKGRFVIPAVRMIFVIAFLTIIAAGLFGDQNPAHNIAPLLTWTIWWVGLVFLVLFVGKAWCTVCPWDAIATWIERIGFTSPRQDGLGLGLKWPRALRNIWPAVALFLLLTWIELGMGITQIPRATAYVALGMLGMSIASALIFERKAFCRYACLVGRVSGLYSLFSSLELRTADPAACDSCKTMDCYRGNEKGDGCPTFEFPKTMNLSTYCILCTECIRTCPADNVTIKLRPWGSDLIEASRARIDEAVLALVLLSMTAFHGLTMTPVWFEIVGSTEATLGVQRSFAFVILMLVILTFPIGIYAIICALAARLSGRLTTRSVFIEYAYAMLPIALFYHLAHNAEHFLMEGPRIFTLVSDPFGWSWDLFGTAGLKMGPWISLEGLWILQVTLIIIGHIYGLWVSSRITRRLVTDRKPAIASQIPMLFAMVLFSFASLWLLNQPMEMRLSGM